ncbi:MAG: hypothetical protein RIR26_1545 [Pseudomonadota bacterium]|jgi:hypothetical protein
MKVYRKSVLWGSLGGACGTLLLLFSTQVWNSRNNAVLSSSPVDPLDVAPSQSLFQFRGQPVTSAQLSPELKNQFERAHAQRLQVRRDADLQFFKEVDKIARLHVLEKSTATLSATQQVTLTEAEEKLFQVEEAGSDDARLLYEASDPSAPREGFPPVRKQLIGYLNQVRRREALEKWSNTLRAQGEWSVSLPRPKGTLEANSWNVDGLPREGKGPVNMVVFVDYLCEGCVPFYVELAQQLERHRASLKPVYVPFPYTKPESGMALARASLCAQELGAFSAFHMAALTKGELLEKVSVYDLARQTEMQAGDFKACYRSGEGLAELLARAQGMARAAGLMQTPAVVFQEQLFEGVELLKSLDKVIAAAEPRVGLTKRDGENKQR